MIEVGNIAGGWQDQWYIREDQHGLPNIYYTCPCEYLVDLMQTPLEGHKQHLYAPYTPASLSISHSLVLGESQLSHDGSRSPLPQLLRPGKTLSLVSSCQRKKPWDTNT